MNGYFQLTREQAIEKFGSHFMITCNPSFKEYSITEFLINYDQEEEEEQEDECLASDLNYNLEMLLERMKSNSKNVIERYEKMTTSIEGRWNMFKFRQGLGNEGFRAFVRKLEADYAQATADLADSDLVSKIEIKYLPETIYVPKFAFEKGKTYYYYRSISNTHQVEIVEVIVDSYNIYLDNKGRVRYHFSFVRKDGKNIDCGVRINNKENFNTPYFNSGYSHDWVFKSKDECKEFIKHDIESKIERLKNFLDNVE